MKQILPAGWRRHADATRPRSGKDTVIGPDDEVTCRDSRTCERESSWNQTSTTSAASGRP
jgi:hypothetical protein